MSAGTVAAALYTGLSLLAALAFFIGTLLGDYDWVARVGGTTWVFLLSMIILMPIAIPWVRERMNR
jgi:cytochrome c biogenesis protein CcdA